MAGIARNFMQAPIPETAENLARIAAVLQSIPTHEPANEGPADEEFENCLADLTELVAGTDDDPFPDVTVTDQQQYATKQDR